MTKIFFCSISDKIIKKKIDNEQISFYHLLFARVSTKMIHFHIFRALFFTNMMARYQVKLTNWIHVSVLVSLLLTRIYMLH